MKEFWNSRTIYRKIVIVAMALQFIGWFIIPFAEMYKGAAAIKKALRGFGTDAIPEKFTMFNLGKFMLDMGGSDWIFYWLVIVLNLVLLVIIILGQKRASYVISLVLWQVVALFAGIGIAAAGSVYGYEGNPFTTMLIYAITAVVMIGSLLGAIFEYKAQAKLAARNASGHTSTAGGSIDTEKLKEQAGNLADTGAAVAKKTAKMAVKGFFKASEAAKDFVESAKNESGVSSAPKSAPAQAPTPKQQPAAHKNQTAIPKSGKVTGVKGMYAGAAIDIVPGEFVIIGRSAEKANLVIDNDMVGRQHCIIQYDGNSGNYIVTDYSTNGTFLGNGSRLKKQQPTTVAPGTVIAIVNKENTFQLG